MSDIKAGTTSYSIPVLLRKSADSTELTGIAFGSVTAEYTRQNAAPVSITTASLAANTTAWTSGGWKETDSTNAPGLYRFDIPDAAFATGVDKVTITVKVATAFLYVEKFDLKVNIASDIATTLGVAGAGLTALGDTRLAFLTGDAFARLGVNGAGLSAIGDARLAFLTGDSFTRLGVAGVGLTNLGDTRIANLDAAISTRTKPADTQAAVTTVGSVSGNIGGNVTGTVASVVGAVGSVTGNVGGSVATVTNPVALSTTDEALFTSLRAMIVSNVFTTASLVNAPTGGSAPSVTAIRTEMDTNSTKLALIGGAVASVTAPVALSTSDESLFTSLRAMITSNVFTTPALANAPSGTGASAVSIRTEMDNNSTKLIAIKAQTDTITVAPTASAVAAAVMGTVIETGLTFAQSMELIAAILGGKYTPSTGEFSAAGNASTNRAQVTIASDGTRTFTLTL